MKRMFRMSFVIMLVALITASFAFAQNQVIVSGRIAPSDVRIFLKDSIYVVQKDYVVAGTLIIEPGTKILFYPNSRLIDSVGGRIIADGYAQASYNQYPNKTGNNANNGWDPIQLPDGVPSFDPSDRNPYGWIGFSDLNYFTYKATTNVPATGVIADSVIKVSTKRDLTVNAAKYNTIFNVILNRANRKIYNLSVDASGNATGYTNENGVFVAYNPAAHSILTFEEALMWKASRMDLDPNSDINLTQKPWKRLAGTSVDITSNQIMFVGQPVNNISREWGHIVVLPGARAAFFRNAVFQDFKKETETEKRSDYYTSTAKFAGDKTNWADVNTKMRNLTNGSGGALTTFSSRTWLIDVEFKNNTAKFRGGALQILQAPVGFNGPNYNNYDASAPAPNPLANHNQFVANMGANAFYALDKNPNITDRDGSSSAINDPLKSIFADRVLRTDNIDETDAEPFSSDLDRQVFEDGRLSVYLGRMRGLKFTNNQLVHANTIQTTDANGAPIVTFDTANAADYPAKDGYGNHAFGGAVYISGAETVENRQMEVGFGINNSIKIAGVTTNFDKRDQITFTGNNAKNYQTGGGTAGARGGALYVGEYTSVILAGKYISNFTSAPLLEKIPVSDMASFSQGGAVYAKNTFGRVQIIGGPQRDADNNSTEFRSNRAGAGGAVYVDGNSDPTVSPILGGADNTLNNRDKGFNIVFDANIASNHGGAIFSRRNMIINGAGGVEGTELIGYGGKYAIRFRSNQAGYSGGAIDLHIPNASPLPASQRNVYMARAVFQDNIVGLGLPDANKTQVRGGGAVYALNADLNVVKGVEFNSNIAYNGNGGAVTLVHPQTSSRRFFITDLDVVNYEDVANPTIATSYTSTDGVFTFATGINYPADTRMLTRFINNQVIVDQDILTSQSGSGTTQIGKGTLATKNTLYGTFWASNTTGWAVGSNGTIVKFTDGGANWTYQNSGTAYRLNKVWFTDLNNGFAVGEQSTMLKTTNGGNSWTSIPTPTIYPNEINDIQFNGKYGYAVANGGYFISSNDNGNFWSFDKIHNVDLKSVYFTSSGNNGKGFVVGENKSILKTTDNGFNWEVQNAPYPSNVTFNAISFLSSTTGYVVGNNGAYLKTTNGGDAWTVENANTTRDLTAVLYVTNNKGFLLSRTGEILTTTDGGGNWTVNNTITNFGIYDLAFPSLSTGYIVGDLGLIIKTTDGGTTWDKVLPTDNAFEDVVRRHREVNLPENGVGLGGALYLLDKVTLDRVGRADTVQFNRVRIQNNKAFTGAAIYSDNYDLKMILNKSLITGNEASSQIGINQNVITGPVVKDSKKDIVANAASSDLVGAIIYGEVQGPLPSYTFSVNSNVIDANKARFLIRLPDAPNSKSILAGTTGIGSGGTDTLRGNYWGPTEANVNLTVNNSFGLPLAVQETFFVAADTVNQLPFYLTPSKEKEQGPFERGTVNQFTYNPVPLSNKSGSETEAHPNSIPERLLMSGRVYDIYDKGTDIKTADYSKRRSSPIEDFAVGIPPIVNRYSQAGLPSNGKYVKRFVRDPYSVNLKNDKGDLVYPYYASLQDEFRPIFKNNVDTIYTHPIGYPLYLETSVDYSGIVENNNHDANYLNESVFFVINTNSGDYIRANFKQVSENAPFRNVFRSTVELIPDSTVRDDKNKLRRTYEGLAILGNILNDLRYNAAKEDAGALQGRKYMAKGSQLGDSLPGTSFNTFAGDSKTNLFTDPKLLNSDVVYFAGERYKALPVKVGDSILVVSRTVLWKEGEGPAFKDGIRFRIESSTKPPVFTGNVVKLQKDTIIKIVPSKNPFKQQLGIPDTLVMVELSNRIHVTENRIYPSDPGTYSSLKPSEGQGRDSLFTVTAVDSNKFYDPRAEWEPSKFTALTYTWTVAPGSALNRWLMADTIYADNTIQQNPRDEAKGYIVFRGIPLNPYVVPGGEEITVTAANYPPSSRLVDSLKNALGSKLSQAEIDKFVETYPDYMMTPKYDLGQTNNVNNARFLQQDTVNPGNKYIISHTTRISTVNISPRFFEDDYNGKADSAVERRFTNGDVMDTVAIYSPSVYTCGRATDNVRLKANLTDKLRFQVDMNTDDEAEDDYARKYFGWDFNFGQTSYNFHNYTISTKGNTGSPDSVGLDTTLIYQKNPDGSDIIFTVMSQSRPAWMANQYLYKYNSDVANDQFGSDFIGKGQLNIRVDSATAIELLKPVPQYNNALNTDTTFTVIVNDGHGGKAEKRLSVFVNVQPRITTQTLWDAKEGTDYNPDLLDSNTRIRVLDPNFGQNHEFQLIYEGDSRDSIYKDPCYKEAGGWDIKDKKTTPKWLKINSQSGILYGTPQLNDGPKTETIVVAVKDAEDLWDLKTYTIFVDSLQHDPKFVAVPPVDCFDIKGTYVDTIKIVDPDLKRTIAKEKLNLSVVSPSGFTLTPSVIDGPLTNDTVKVAVTYTGTSTPPRDADGKITITINVTDTQTGKIHPQLKYRIKVSDETDFTTKITVSNSKGAFQELTFGTSSVSVNPATTGDGTDGAPEGKLDENFCEYELPAIPPTDVFDTRWSIVKTNGTLRSIYPTNTAQAQRWYAQIQPGGENGQTGANFPIKIKWNLADVPAYNDKTKNPKGSTWYLRDANSNGGDFNINMNTGDYKFFGKPEPSAGYSFDKATGTFTIINTDLSAFVIYRDWNSDVEVATGLMTGLKDVSPNPIMNGSVVNFELAESNNVTIQMVDVLGNVVKTLVNNAAYTPGTYSITMNSNDNAGNVLANGSYIIRMVAGNVTSNVNVMLVK